MRTVRTLTRVNVVTNLGSRIYRNRGAKTESNRFQVLPDGDRWFLHLGSLITYFQVGFRALKLFFFLLPVNDEPDGRFCTPDRDFFLCASARVRESDRAIGWMTECDDERVFPLSNPQTGARNPSFIATHLAKLAKSCTSGPTPIVEEA